MLIVAGWIAVAPSEREAYLVACDEVVRQARQAPGCLDFAISPDLLDDARINIYERWDSEPQLMDFRGSGPDFDQSAAITAAEMSRYEISAVSGA